MRRLGERAAGEVNAHGVGCGAFCALARVQSPGERAAGRHECPCACMAHFLSLIGQRHSVMEYITPLH